MSWIATLIFFGSICLAVSWFFLTNQDDIPAGDMASPSAIESGSASAAAEARTWNKLRGYVFALLGGALLFGALVVWL